MSAPADHIDTAFPGVAPGVVEAFRNTPDNVVAEFLEGTLSIDPPPDPRRANILSRLAGVLRAFHDPAAGEPGGWVVLIRSELHLGSSPDVIVPDLAGWRRARLAEEPTSDAIHVAPDWVCEILSDETKGLDRGLKRRIYRRESVDHLWLCDPRIQTLEVYRLKGGRWTELDTFEGDTKVRAEPFDAVELDLARIWRW